MLLFPKLEKEREATEVVKRGFEILVFLGNPRYSGYLALLFS